MLIKGTHSHRQSITALILKTILGKNLVRRRFCGRESTRLECLHTEAIVAGRSHCFNYYDFLYVLFDAQGGLRGTHGIPSGSTTDY